MIAQTFHKVTLQHQKEPQLDKYHHFSQLWAFRKPEEPELNLYTQHQPNKWPTCTSARRDKVTTNPQLMPRSTTDLLTASQIWCQLLVSLQVTLKSKLLEVTPPSCLPSHDTALGCGSKTRCSNFPVCKHHISVFCLFIFRYLEICLILFITTCCWDHSTQKGSWPPVSFKEKRCLCWFCNIKICFITKINYNYT